MHEDPQILHYGRRGTGILLEEGMVFTIEPMVNQGRAAIAAESEEWPVYTRDGSLSAQFEHTVVVTRKGVRVLTLRPGEAALCHLDSQ
jgi:methionyl aminopeptidase